MSTGGLVSGLLGQGVKQAESRFSGKRRQVKLSWGKAYDLPDLIDVSSDATFADVNDYLGSVSRLDGQHDLVVLEEIPGPRPCWRLKDPSKIIPQTVIELYIVDTKQPFVLALAQTLKRSYPVRLQIDLSAPILMKNIMDDILGTPKLGKSISHYDGSVDISPEALYEHDVSKKLPSFPTIFVIYDQNDGDEFDRNWKIEVASIPLQSNLLRAQNLTKVAASRKLFTLQCIHVSKAIVHMLISSGKEDRFRRAELTFEGILNRLDSLFNDIEHATVDTQTSNWLAYQLHHAFFTCCFNYPGAIQARNSFPKYVQLGEVDLVQCKKRYGVQYECLPLAAQWDLDKSFLYDESLVTLDSTVGDDDWSSSSDEGAVSDQEPLPEPPGPTTEKGKEALPDTQGLSTTPKPIAGPSKPSGPSSFAMWMNPRKKN